MKQNFLLGAMALAGLFASCSQTEMEEAANVPQKGNEVTVTVAPSADFTQPRTRAESGQQLRYIAELWEEDKTTDPATTKKMIARTEQVGTDANRFTFDIEQQGDYVILFWADYIAAATTSDKTISRSSGTNTFSVSFKGYPDNRFTTDGNKASEEGLQYVHMKKGAGSDEFYNETLEAFCGNVSFTKEADIVSLSQVTLKRPLCKYIFKESTADLAGISTVNIKDIQARGGYDVYKKEVKHNLSYSAIEGKAINILDSSAKQLFSFYSFWGEEEGTLPGGVKFNFTASTENSKKYKVIEIKSEQIPCRANYKYTLSGSFVQEDLTGPAVNVDVTCDENWTSEDKTINN